MEWLRARVRLWELVPEALVGAGLLLLLLTEPDAATSAFESSRALALMAIVSVGWAVLRVLVTRCIPIPTVRLAVFGAAAAGVLAVVVLPAYDDTTVVETLPTASLSSTTSLPGVPTSATTTSAPPGVPVAVRTGSLHGIDHRAEGSVVLYRQPDGSFVVGLEEIDVQPGPDYDVYVVPGADREDKDGGIHLDDLRGNKGTQYYEVPTGTDLGAGRWTVLIWCQTFAVPVAGSTLT